MDTEQHNQVISSPDDPGSGSNIYGSIKEAAKTFQDLSGNSPVRIIARSDSDGIAACAIMVTALSRQGIPHVVRTIRKLNKSTLLELERENYPTTIFLDIGSSHIPEISRILQGGIIFILDHHSSPQITDNESPLARVTHVNPRLHGSGSEAVSGAGLAFLFARALDAINADLIHLAIVGMIGESQGDSSELNNEIIEEALLAGHIKQLQGITAIGMQTSALHRVLQHSSELCIPKIYGSESGALQFLKEIGIKPRKNNNQWRCLTDLSGEELTRLADKITSRLTNRDPQDSLLGKVYSLENEADGSSLKDVKEFSLILRACGRLDRASLAIGACLGDQTLRKEAVDTLADYQTQLLRALKWFDRNKSTDAVQGNAGYVVINAPDDITPVIFGELVSILSSNETFPEGDYILSLSKLDNLHLQGKLMVSGDNEDIDLLRVLGEIASNIDIPSDTIGEKAAQVRIPKEKCGQFLSQAKVVLERLAKEERVS